MKLVIIVYALATVVTLCLFFVYTKYLKMELDAIVGTKDEEDVKELREQTPPEENACSEPVKKKLEDFDFYVCLDDLG